jgi:hypothetical protein
VTGHRARHELPDRHILQREGIRVEENSAKSRLYRDLSSHFNASCNPITACLDAT